MVVLSDAFLHPAAPYSFDCNAAVGLTDSIHSEQGTELEVLTPEGPREAVVRKKFWGRF